MKKLLTVLLATSSVVAFADSFRDFNNNVYVDYTLSNNSNMPKVGQLNYLGLGTTIQTKNNIWIDANALGGNSVNGNVDTANLNVRAGYAFDVSGNANTGWQIIPYASFALNTGSAHQITAQTIPFATAQSYTWGLGVQPEFRFGSWKAALGAGLSGANGTFGPAVVDNNTTTIFAFNVNPQIQYDIAKTLFVAAGYNYAATFNAQSNATANNLTVKFGYLF